MKEQEIRTTDTHTGQSRTHKVTVARMRIVKETYGLLNRLAGVLTVGLLWAISYIAIGTVEPWYALISFVVALVAHLVASGLELWRLWLEDRRTKDSDQ